jgi:hypothetical protein
MRFDRVLVMALALAPPCSAQDLQLFNPGVLGRSPTEPTALLLQKPTPTAIQPSVISLDTRCGRYIAASAYYQKPLTMADVRSALDKTYASDALKKHNPNGNLWRVERAHFAIQLMDGGDDGIRVVYVHFVPSTQELFKDVAKFSGVKEVPDADCAAWDRMFSDEAASKTP